MTIPSPQQPKPPVRISEADYDHLLKLAEGHCGAGAALLADELDRAVVVGEGAATDFARLYSFVRFTDLTSGRMRRVQLAPPNEADIDNGRLSVVTPVGAALIGLTAGDSFALETDNGSLHVLLVSEVEHTERRA